MPSERESAKARRRSELLGAAAALFAAEGFHSTTLGAVAAEAGVSAPAVYRHFDSKHELLAELLIDVSERLLAGGLAAAAAPDPLHALCAAHARFAVSEAAIIRVQERELTSLEAAASHRVRSLQAEYVQLWVNALAPHLPGAEPAELGLRVHAALGLLNSTPHGLRRSGAVPDPEALLTQLSLAALTAQRAPLRGASGSAAVR
ncbi:TetR/AcrR family transcriptional regulator [Galactobacter caseinivorans]|uniref:TetR/AcrR family transcriptional regulator n=1 Tax=Galactobacter caseinivorans TaxID=2676123 RepID=A0A496PJT2_9MICC|nr:TetR/AcrR family transcriptional regulator [Galactobacter caseinivorans]RKW70755.1 TetR/AcrR family transcriptional regulator [Galactobacter caseinivorans]